MRIDIQGHSSFVSTGGRAFDPHAGRVLVFLHGSGQSHLSWLMQARYFANRGFQVLAPDFPGHGLSAGEALVSIEAQADWLQALLTALGCQDVTLIGHSQGCLVALELAARPETQVKTLVLTAGALSIPVNDALLGAARDKQDKAIMAMMEWGHGQKAGLHDHSLPGVSHIHLGRQVMQANRDGALYADLQACAAYQGGAKAAANITCPTLCLLAQQDRMTPLKAGRAMAAAIDGAETQVIAAGHMLPAEAPDAVNAAILAFMRDTS